MKQILKDIKELDTENTSLEEEMRFFLRRIEYIFTEKNLCFLCGKGLSEHKKEEDHLFVSNLALQDIDYESKEPFYTKRGTEGGEEEEKRYFLVIRDKQIMIKIVRKDNYDEVANYIWLQNASHKIVRKIIESGAFEKLLYELSELPYSLVLLKLFLEEYAYDTSLINNFHTL